MAAAAAAAASCSLFLMFVVFTTNHFLTPSSASDHYYFRQSTTGGAAGELWCVAKNNAENNALQMALDWACGQGGANCGPIQLGGPCYDPADITRTASYAFNDYFLKHGLTEDSCNFDNTAALTSLNPSHGKCKIPSSSSVSSSSSSSINGSSTTRGGFISPPGSDSSADLNDGSNDRSHRWVLLTVVVVVLHLLAFISSLY